MKAIDEFERVVGEASAVADGFWALKRRERRAELRATLTDVAHKTIFDAAYFQALYDRKKVIAAKRQA